MIELELLLDRTWMRRIAVLVYMLPLDLALLNSVLLWYQHFLSLFSLDLLKKIKNKGITLCIILTGWMPDRDGESNKRL